MNLNYVLRTINNKLFFITSNLITSMLVIKEFHSPTIQLVAYDGKRDEMIVKMNSNEVYCYRDVPKELFETCNGVRSIGSWIDSTIKGKYSFYRATGSTDIRVPTNEEIVLMVDHLQHHLATTVGLWATDRPDLIKDRRNVMFQIKA